MNGLMGKYLSTLAAEFMLIVLFPYPSRVLLPVELEFDRYSYHSDMLAHVLFVEGFIVGVSWVPFGQVAAAFGF